MPSLLCLLSYDAFSDHAFLFLCMSMHLETDLSPHEDTHKTHHRTVPPWVRSVGPESSLHYRRGTLVESRPCWQVVPLPSPAVPSTRSDEHLSDPESFCHSPSLPFPILIPSVTLPLCRFLGFPYTPILPPRLFPLPLPPGRKTNLKCPPFSVYYFMTHPLTTHFFFCV